jgi:GxxExxY protein
MVNLIYKDEVYTIVGACMTVYNALGFGFLEVVYKDAMEIEFIVNQMEYTREQELYIL